jgi:hypothetical protein
MQRPRYTIAELILVVLVIALGLAAIRIASASWAGAMYSIMFFALICSFLGVALGRGSRRIYWSGFALLGWSYIILMYTPWLYDKFGQYLLAPNLFAYLEEVLHQDQPAGGGMQSLPPGLLGATATAGGFAGPVGVDASSELVRIGIAMEALLWAFLGGWAARYFASGPDGALAAGATAAARGREPREGSLSDSPRAAESAPAT